MNDSEWFHCNPDRLVRRRRLAGDVEMWIVSLHDTSETLLVRGRLALITDSDEALHVVVTELLLEGIVDAERVHQALQLVLEAGSGSDVFDRGEGVDTGAFALVAPRVVWPSFPVRQPAIEQLDLVGKA